MHIQYNISLRPYNTFGMDMPARQFFILDNEDQLTALSTDPAFPHKKILGGGSNILLTQPVDELLIANRMKGIQLIQEDADHVWLEVRSGEIWHELVLYTLERGWAGLENLALIPGTVGAAPIQNIGAYGVEVKETIEKVTVWHWETAAFYTYTNEECHFGYRDSIFKNKLKDQVLVTSVTFRLSKRPVFRTTYGAINTQLEQMQVSQPSLRTIAEAVMTIRRSKLPDPKQTGNAGSFFKNPVISPEHFELLQTNYPNIPFYPAPENQVKIPAGWLIEQCGWKGYRNGDAGVHDRQALVLVNYGHATGNEIRTLSDEIIQSVHERFGITLEREVQIW